MTASGSASSASMRSSSAGASTAAKSRWRAISDRAGRHMPAGITLKPVSSYS